jgi:hypothetical protein
MPDPTPITATFPDTAVALAARQACLDALNREWDRYGAGRYAPLEGINRLQTAIAAIDDALPPALAGSAP